MKFNENDLKNAILSCDKSKINKLYCDICAEIENLEKQRQMIAVTLKTLKVAKFDDTEDFKNLKNVDTNLLGTIITYRNLRIRAFNAYTYANSLA